MYLKYAKGITSLDSSINIESINSFLLSWFMSDTKQYVLKLVLFAFFYL